jgi:hypothetical protein
MAEYLSKDEIRNYPLSNGTTVDLLALVAAGAPADWRTPMHEELAVGQVAYVAAMGAMRRGVIVKVTRTKAHVAFTTQGAVDEADRYRSGRDIRVQVTVDNAAGLWVAPLAPATLAEDLDEAPVFETVEISQELETPAETAEREAEEDARDLPVNLVDARDLKLDLVAEAAWEGEGGALAPTLKMIEKIRVSFQEPEAPAAQPAPAAPVTGSAIVAVLEQTWEAIRANHPELPHVVIVTGSGFVGSPRWAHWRESGWTEHGRKHEDTLIDHIRHGEMFVAGEALAKGAAHVVESMLHEGAHALATARQVQDTSRQGRWHNGTFRKLAEELGLAFQGDKADSTHGFSNMLLTPETREKYADLIKELDEAIRATIKIPGFVPQGEDGQAGGEFVHGGKRPKTGTASNTNNLKLTCCCVDEETGDAKPRIIRASRKEAERGQMMCGVCREYFEVRD